MERILYMILKRFFIAPYWYYRICKFSNQKKYTEQERYNEVHKIVKKVNKAANVEIICDGKENIPEQPGYIFFPNHQGMFDALLLLETNINPITFVLKKELENNWFIKKVIKILDAQVIDREDIRQSLGVINKMTSDVKNGRNYVIFAEGTRSKTNEKLLDFKGGSFKSAVNAKCPIIPVAIINSYKVMDSKSIKKVKVIIHYLKPVYYEEYKNMKTVQIAEKVKENIENYMREYIDDMN